MRFLLLLVWLAGSAFAGGPDAGRKPRVAVLYFDVLSTNADLKVFSKGLAELLISDLVANDGLEVLERSRIEEVLAELKLGESRFADKGSFEKAGRVLGADYLVLGSLIGNKQLKVTARVVAVGTASIPKSARVDLNGDDVFEAESRLVAEVAQQLVALGALARAPEPPKRGHKLPLSTATKYARALDAKDKKDKDAAVKLLTDVVKEQPEFKLAQLDLLSLTK